MARLTRNAVQCERCGGIAESKRVHDYMACRCGNIAVDGGLAYERLCGSGLEDASYEPLYEYDDGKSPAGFQFIPLLNGPRGWNGGDGRALHRLLTALVAGRAPAVTDLNPSGLRRLGYLAEIALLMSPEPGVAAELDGLIERLRTALGNDRDDDDVDADLLWIPPEFAGADQRAFSWRLPVGLNEETRRVLREAVQTARIR